MAFLKEHPTLPDLQVYVQEFCKEKGFDKGSYLEDFLLLSEEIGELARAMREEEHLRIDTTKCKNNELQEDNALEEEFADVFHYILNLANRFHIDLEKAFREKVLVNQARHWEVVQ